MREHTRAAPPVQSVCVPVLHRQEYLCPPARDALEGGGVAPPPFMSLAVKETVAGPMPSLRPATVPLTPSASFNGI